MITSDLERSNEWWFTGAVREELAPPYHRHVFEKIAPTSDKARQVTILTGLRRVGKSTLLFQMVKKLLGRVQPKRILYFAFDEGENSVRDVIDAYEREVLARPIAEAGEAFIILDEVQYAADWYTMVKRLYDLYPKLRFFLSGSSSLLISKRARKALAGRFRLVEVPPLSFREFLEMRGTTTEEPRLHEGRLRSYFSDYLRRAGFPEIVGWESEKAISDYIRNSVIDRVALRDMPLLFGAKDISLLEKTSKLIITSPGIIVNLDSLSRELGASRVTLSNYLGYLETSLLIKSLGNFRTSTLSSSRKLRKYYPALTSLTFSVDRGAFDRNRGGVLETYVVNFLGARHYYKRGRLEADILLTNGRRTVAIEVKERAGDEDFQKLRRVAAEVKAKSWHIVSGEGARGAGASRPIPAYALEWEVQKLKDA